MARTQRNFFTDDYDDEWNDGKSVRKHVNKSKRLKIKQNLRDFDLDFDDVESIDNLVNF